ncbi:MAG: ABC transporter ATP-binding protein [Deltaproteobacteria bacterium]|nr:ABC transporter ATP-binding protein [Deltaproteobacteria bacterium]MBW2305307.1 ABC transporter ATP-binding protein [Deltaproteobacteria bacterium]
MAFLEIRNVAKSFGGLMANNDISFSVEQGEIIGLIGPNGAGKTTLFNCIAGFYPPTRGKIFFAGEDITGLAPEKICLKGVARTFQIVRIFKDMTVLDNVMIGAFCRTNSTSRARAKAEEILDFVGLTDVQFQISAGLTLAGKKRMEFAKALATEPNLIMLDEAMAGLNPSETRDAVELVKRMRQKGLTVLLVEHVMEAVMPISDRVVVLDYGVKIAEDKPENIVTNEEVIKAYLGEKVHVARQ